MSIYQKAIRLEQEGAAYYEEQAEKHPESAIHSIFKILAEAERRHELAILEYRQQAAFAVPEPTQSMEKTFFATAADVEVEYYLVPRALDVYLTALEMERKSIRLYQDQLDQATDEAEKALLEWLVAEEEKHYDQLDKLIEMIRHGDEYVTHAMFTNMPEY
jgi:rubrerythrin